MRVRPILAYSDENVGEFPDEDDMPPAMVEMLEWYEAQIEYLRDSTTDNTINPQWTQYANMLDLEAITIIVHQLLYRNGLENKWGQSGNNSGSYIEKSYNKFCPARHDNDQNCEHTIVGCVAVATSQVMWYWQWPNAAVVKDDNANYLLRDYDWELMPPTLTNASSLDEVDMIANLLHDVGVAVNMNYGCSASGAQTSNIVTALRNIFNFNADNVSYRSSYSNNEWLSLLKNELNNSRPILYSGFRSGGIGHQFVLDGYNSANEFHVNYGWRGSSNGYYLLDTIRNGTDPYKSHQNAIFNVMPNYPSCSAIEIQPSASWQTNFAIFNGGGMTISNRTITSNQKGIIYSGEYVRLTNGVHITNGSIVHIAIRDIECESNEINNAPSKRYAPSQNMGNGTMENKLNQSFSISPNPAYDILTITTTEDLVDAAIYNLNGQCILNTVQTEINVSNLPNGIYIIRATNISGQPFQAKFIKQ